MPCRNAFRVSFPPRAAEEAALLAEAVAVRAPCLRLVPPPRALPPPLFGG